MLTGGTDQLYRDMLAGAHDPVVRIDVFDGDGVFLHRLESSASDTIIDPDRSILSGSVNATLANRVTRNCTFTVHEDLYPAQETDLLAPYGNFIRAYRGIRLADGNERYVWQVFEGRIQDTDTDDSGTVTVACSDWATDVVDNEFLVPFNSTPGLDCVAQMQEVISNQYPGATFGTSDTFGLVMPLLTSQNDPGQFLDSVAQGLGAFWYPLADGNFVVRRIPWTVAGAPVVSLRDGEGGTILGFQAGRSRSGVYNQIVATGERADGTTPVYAVAVDNNPDSPTYNLGKFGKRTRNISMQTPASTGAVQSAANDQLRSSKALTEAWGLSIIPDASLELGDVVSIDARKRTGVVQVISGFQLPLDFVTAMGLTMRSQVVGLLEVT